MTKIIVLQELFADMTERMVQSLVFMAKMTGHAVEVSSSTFNQITNDAAVLVYLDSANLKSFQDNKQFVQAISQHSGICIAIVDELVHKKMPECLSNAQVYLRQSAVEAEEQNNNAESNLEAMAHNVICYLKSIATNNPSGFSLFLGMPDAESAPVFQGVLLESEHRGFNVYPQVINPSGKNSLADRQLVFSQLDKCQLAIHFISHKMMEHYPQEQCPAMQLNHLVAEYCNQPGHESLKRIIYITPEDSNTSPEVSRHIAEFKNNSFDLANAELVQVPLERLKNVLISRYMEWATPAETKSVTFDIKPLYFIFPPHKEKNVNDICKWLENNGLLYNKSQVDLDQLDLLRYHEAVMTQCRGLLIYNDGNEQWLKRKINDVVKSPGWGRQTNFKFIVICGEKLSESCSKAIHGEADFAEMTGTLNYEQLKNIISD